MALMETLVDDFTSGTINSTKWPTVSAGISVVSGRLQLVDSTGAYPSANSASSYDIRNSYALAQVTPAPRSGGNSQQTYFMFYASSGNGFGLAVGDTTLYKVTTVGGVETDTSIATYNATTHAWWRIRHNGTNIVLGWSSDGTTWTEGTPFAPGVTLGTTGSLVLQVGRYTSGDTATGYFDNVNNPPASSTPKSGSDTASGADSAGTVVQKYTGTETGTGTDNAGSIVGAYSGTDTGSGADSVATVRKTEADTGSGTDSSGSVLVTQNLTSADTASAAESVGSVVVATIKSGSDTASAVEDTTARKLAEAEAFAAIEGVSGKIHGDTDARTVVDAGTVENISSVPKSGSETVTRVEAETAYGPGGFTQIPSPKMWSNGDSLDHGTLNKEWRDTFSWLLRSTSPGISVYNSDGASLTYTNNVAIPLKTEEFKRGNLTHATNDTKVYVWETGWYLGYCQIGADYASVTSDGLKPAAIVKVNGLTAARGQTTRDTNAWAVVELQFSLYLSAGDYVEIALGNDWVGTLKGIASAYAYPFLSLWWRSN